MQDSWSGVDLYIMSALHVHRPGEWHGTSPWARWGPQTFPSAPISPLYVRSNACPNHSSASRTLGHVVHVDGCQMWFLLQPVRGLAGRSPESWTLGYHCGNKPWHQAASSSATGAAVPLLSIGRLAAWQTRRATLEPQQHCGRKLPPQSQAVMLSVFPHAARMHWGSWLLSGGVGMSTMAARGGVKSASWMTRLCRPNQAMPGLHQCDCDVYPSLQINVDLF